MDCRLVVKSHFAFVYAYNLLYICYCFKQYIYSVNFFVAHGNLLSSNSTVISAPYFSDKIRESAVESVDKLFMGVSLSEFLLVYHLSHVEVSYFNMK